MDFETSLINAIENNDSLSLKVMGIDQCTANQMISKILRIPQKKGEFRLPSVSYPTPLILAICCRQFQSVSALISIGASLTQQVQGWAPIHFAVLSQDQKIAELLLSKDKSLINAQSTNGSTPLHFAVSNSSLQMVLFLLSNGADPNIENSLKQTPLHLAMACTDIKIINALIAFKANLGLKDKEGHTNEDIARLHNKFEYAEYIANIQSGKEPMPTKEEVLSNYIYDDAEINQDVNIVYDQQQNNSSITSEIDDIEKRVALLESKTNK